MDRDDGPVDGVLGQAASKLSGNTFADRDHDGRAGDDHDRTDDDDETDHDRTSRRRRRRL